MTYEQDPARWTASPDEAPELLRGAFSAARNEGPSQNQMRSLALKIAAVSAGGAVAMGAAKGASTFQAAASATTWSVGKIAGIVALAGGLATTAVIWQQSSSDTKTVPARPIPAQTQRVRPPEEAPVAEAPAEAAPAPSATADAPQQAPVVAPVSTESGRDNGAQASARRTTSREISEGKAPVMGPSTSEPVARTKSATVSDKPAVSNREADATNRDRNSAKRGSGLTIVAAPNETRALTEIELLRQAKNALRSRPREAYQLTEQHRQQYPGGEFAQERDALAIQALIGAGETEMARDLAVAFIKAHPTSPHAHRFREAMGIR